MTKRMADGWLLAGPPVHWQWAMARGQDNKANGVPAESFAHMPELLLYQSVVALVLRSTRRSQRKKQTSDQTMCVRELP